MDDIDLFNAVRPYDAARLFVERLPDDFQVDIPDGPTAINQDRVDDLARLIQDFIANVVAMLIDAGSERDAVNEAEELHEALKAELKGWSDHPDNLPNEEA